MEAITANNELLLLQQTAAGDEAAFSELFRRYHHLLGQHIYRITESREITEEIVQDVFLKVWLIREGLTEVENFRAWLFTIARNHALNALRAVARQRVKHQQWEKEIQVREGLDEINVLWGDMIEKAIDALPEQQKKVYLLSRREGLTYNQIADRMQLSHETVKFYMKLAIAAVTKRIKKEAGLAIALLLISRF